MINNKLTKMFQVMTCFLILTINILVILLKRLPVKLTKATLLMIQVKRENLLHHLHLQKRNQSKLHQHLSHLNKKLNKLLLLLHKHQHRERQMQVLLLLLVLLLPRVILQPLLLLRLQLHKQHQLILK
jgi:hypothetical protein